LSETVLGPRALNRALLERQMLLTRSDLGVAEAIEWLVGLQAQEPRDPYVALWSRLQGFRPAELGELIETGGAVRIATLRGTLHLHTARDCLALRPVVQPVLTRIVNGVRAWQRELDGLDVREVAAVARGLVEAEPLGVAEIGRALRERWPDRDASVLGYAAHYSLPLVQVPPRGVWGRTGRARVTTAEAFLGRELEPETAPDAMVLRYLAAFGPATVGDIRAWCGLSGLREVVDRLRPQLRSFRDERGRELLDVPDGPLPDPATPAPPRFLPEYDNVLLGHDDRTRVLGTERPRPAPEGVSGWAFLVDGFLAGRWRLERDHDAARLIVAPDDPLRQDDADALRDEGARLLALLAADAGSREVVLH
jgi:hypothetical protein